VKHLNLYYDLLRCAYKKNLMIKLIFTMFLLMFLDIVLAELKQETHIFHQRPFLSISNLCYASIIFSVIYNQVFPKEKSGY
jgi:hypothetical protein